MVKKRKGRAVRNAKKGAGAEEAEETVKAPHSFVIHRGKVGKNAKALMYNFRKIMEPFTASQLRVQRKNVIKDFLHMAGPLNVSHLVVFTKSKKGMYFRIAKLPRGPTLTYQIQEYCLIRDVITSQKKSLVYEKLFEHHPLLVLNNFSGEGMHLKLMTTMFQNMFPSINVNKANLNTIRRCLLLHYNEDGTIDLRQYAIKIVPTGISKAVRKLISNKVPNLGKFQTVDEFLEKDGVLSESEAELDSAANTVVLPQPISTRGNIVSEKSAIRLFEIGPRMKLKLLKIEEGLMTGEVMYHSLVKKTPEEIKAIKERLKARKLLKEKRRAEQQKNVERKKAAQNKELSEEEGGEDESDDDAKYYREEVGEDPESDILAGLLKKKKFRENQSATKKRKAPDDFKPSKKRKTENYESKPSKKKRLPEGKMSKGKSSKDSKGQNSKDSKGKNSKDFKGKGSKDSKGKNSKDFKGKGSKDSKGKGSKENLTVQQFLARRKKKKEMRLAKKKSKQMSQKVLSMRAKQKR